jgi:hypothetical protein
MAEGIGNWKSFEDLENHLILDELIMLSEALSKSKKEHYRFMAALEGVDWDDDGDDETHDSGDDLPPELLNAEKAWQKEKEEHLKKSGDLDGFGLGYSLVNKGDIET